MLLRLIAVFNHVLRFSDERYFPNSSALCANSFSGQICSCVGNPAGGARASTIQRFRCVALTQSRLSFAAPFSGANRSAAKTEAQQGRVQQPVEGFSIDRRTVLASTLAAAAAMNLQVCVPPRFSSMYRPAI